MLKAERIIKEILARAGIEVNGTNPWDIRVHDRRFYGRVLRDRSLGLGESYMENWWGCDRLDELFNRICSAGLDYTKARGPMSKLLDAAIQRLLNLQTPRKSKEVAKKHYDLGNDMFLSWLDPYNQYSCGYFAGTDELGKAQELKLDLICRKIGLTGEDRVLDIGCGWGGFSAYAAKQYGCSVTGVNISREQIEHARNACSAQGLAVEIVRRDYREMNDRFDKIVSIGMFEHVGRKNYRTYMRSVRRCLEETGIFLLHTIGSNISTSGCDAWIRRYIFPNGEVPSLAQIARAAEGIFVIEDIHNLGPHYDRTLMAWNERFQAAWPRINTSYPKIFRRMWEYYLLSCAGAFRARAMQLWQIVMTPQGACQPACRAS